MSIKKSTYKNGSGDTVTLYENEAGYRVTSVCGDITLYNPSGDMMSGVRSEEAAIALLKEWK